MTRLADHNELLPRKPVNRDTGIDGEDVGNKMQGAFVWEARTHSRTYF